MSKFERQPKSVGFRKARIDWREVASIVALLLLAAMAGAMFFFRLTDGSLH